MLPLTSLSSALEDRYFAEGVHGELITQLAKISGLRVIARSSVQAYEQGPRDLGAIAANVGPAACWALVTAKIHGSPGPEGMATWVTPLFYGSWLLFAIAIGAATRSYQLRSAAPRQRETPRTERR